MEGQPPAECAGCGQRRFIDLALDRDRAPNRARLFDLARDLALARDLGHVVCTLNDVTGADLRDTDLTGVRLEGLRWSRNTQ